MHFRFCCIKRLLLNVKPSKSFLFNRIRSLHLFPRNFHQSLSLTMSADSGNGAQMSPLAPPSEVRGMKILDRESFKQEIEVPSLLVSVDKIKEVLKVVKPCLLKMPNLNPVEGEGTEKKILLHPNLFSEKHSLWKKVEDKISVNVLWTKVTISYENWTADNIFKAVLPPDSTGNVSSFSIVGHIIHVNLKPDLVEFKHLIGQVLLDKYSNIKTVVNKANIIENEFRNLNIELLAGDPSYDVLVKENNCQFAFDFSKVFWNPRLSNEHDGIVKKIVPRDLAFDVFAGVGPFAVPLAKRKCEVHANDLNPDSYRWLCHNAKLNKVTEYFHSYNLDGREFIQSVIKNGLIKFWSDIDNLYRHVHIIMNLPASALEFLDSFNGLLDKSDTQHIGELPTVYCYFFKRKDEDINDVLAKYFPVDSRETVKISTVRLVAPNKFMMRAEYDIPPSILFTNSDNTFEPLPKRMKLENVPITEE